MSLAEIRDPATNRILFDDRAISLHCIQKGTHSTATNPLVATVGTQSELRFAPGVTSAPLLAFRPRGQRATVAQLTRFPDGTWNYRFMCTGPAGSLIDWWLFSPAPPADGLFEVYNPDTLERTFSAGIRSMIQKGTTLGGQREFPADAGRTFAALQGNLSGRRTSFPVENGSGQTRWFQRWTWDSVVTRADGGIDIAGTVLDQANSGTVNQPPDQIFSPTNFTIVDVTFC